jgi:hypothetical protein
MAFSDPNLMSSESSSEADERVLASRFIRLTMMAIAFLAGALIAIFLTFLLGPDSRLSEIDVPEPVLSLFSDSAPASATVSTPQEPSHQRSNDPFVELTKILLFISPVFLLLPFAIFRLTGRKKDLIPIIMPIVAILIGIDILSDPPPNTEGISPRQQFMRDVSNHRFVAVATSLKELGQDATPAGLYVLAQVALAEGSDDTGGRPRFNADLVRPVTSNDDGFKPRAQALFAIETAAYGKAKSPAAMRYEHERVTRQAWAVNALIVLACVSLAAAWGAIRLRSQLQVVRRSLQGLKGAAE